MATRASPSFVDVVVAVVVFVVVVTRLPRQPLPSARFSFLRTFRHACHMLTARKRPRSGKNIVMVGGVVIVHRSVFATTHRVANDVEMYVVCKGRKYNVRRRIALC